MTTAAFQNFLTHTARCFRVLTLSVIATVAVITAAHAGTPGPAQGEQPATLSATNFITVSGNTVTFSLSDKPVMLTTAANKGDLLGISGIWVVNKKDGSAVTGIKATTGFVTTGKDEVTWTALESDGGFMGFHDDANGSGFSDKAAWLQLANSDLVKSESGKTGSGFTTGSFTFEGLSKLSDYTFAVDYLAGWDGGQTGRAYFSNYSVAVPPAAVPEPGVWVSGAAMGGMTLLGMLRGRRRNRSVVAHA